MPVFSLVPVGTGAVRSFAGDGRRRGLSAGSGCSSRSVLIKFGPLFNLVTMFVDPVDAFLFAGGGIEVNPVTVLSDPPSTLIGQHLFVLVVENDGLAHGFYVKVLI